MTGLSAAENKIRIEYENATLVVSSEVLGDLGKFQPATTWQFLGELETDAKGNLYLRARIARDFSNVSPELYDKCLRIRRRFEKEVLNIPE